MGVSGRLTISVPGYGQVRAALRFLEIVQPKILTNKKDKFINKR
jgi:hypothetical protein